MNRLPYPTDLTDEQWLILEPFFPTSGYGRPPKYTKRELLNTIFYQARTGCAWRLLPHDFPLWSTVYKQFEDWREDGLWDRLLDALRRQVRVAQGRSPEPTAGAIDTQSVPTSGKRGAVTGTMRASK
jgi:putative transposase